MSEYIYTTEGALGLRECTGEEIVRCRDCKHCKRRDGILPPTVCERWGYYNFKTEPDGFCAWGERREP